MALTSIILWFFLFSKDVALPDSYQGKDVGVILTAMPKKDRQNLEVFFRNLFEENPFGYVVLGNKPMAFDTFIQDINLWKQLCQEDKEANQSDDFQPTSFEKFVFFCGEALSYKRFKTIKSYKTWRKYEKFFPLERFVFFYQNAHHFGLNYLTIALINKKAFASKVNQHLNDFREILKCGMSGEDFLTELVQSQSLDLIISHHALLGTLLGFGRDNAFLFHAESHLQTANEKKLFREQNHFEFVWNQEVFHSSLGSTNGLHSIDLPCFIADVTSVETEILRQEYLTERTKIIDYYKGKNFLEATLRLLTSNEEVYEETMSPLSMLADDLEVTSPPEHTRPLA